MSPPRLATNASTSPSSIDRMRTNQKIQAKICTPKKTPENVKENWIMRGGTCAVFLVSRLLLTNILNKLERDQINVKRDLLTISTAQNPGDVAEMNQDISQL
jgi:hypothetical protein